MIKTIKHCLKFQTKRKTQFLEDSIVAYHKGIIDCIDQIISGKIKLEKYAPKEFELDYIKHKHWLHLVYSDASQIIRSQIAKNSKKRYKRYQKVYAHFKETERFKNFLNKKFSELNLKPFYKTKYFHKPKIENVLIYMNCHMFQIDNCRNNHFDKWIRITTPFKMPKRVGLFQYYNINIPIKDDSRTKKLITDGWKLKKTVGLSKQSGKYFVSFIYEKEPPKLREHGTTLAFDQGVNKLLSASNGQHYGQEMLDLYNKIVRKKQGSKTYKGLIKHRDDEIHRIINKIDFSNVKNIVIEKLDNGLLGRLKRYHHACHKALNVFRYWRFQEVSNKLERVSMENGIRLLKVDPKYTSMKCSRCGAVDKESRHFEHFHCTTCGYEIDADTNAAINILNCGSIILNGMCDSPQAQEVERQITMAAGPLSINVPTSVDYGSENPKTKENKNKIVNSSESCFIS